RRLLPFRKRVHRLPIRIALLTGLVSTGQSRSTRRVPTCPSGISWPQVLMSTAARAEVAATSAQISELVIHEAVDRMGFPLLFNKCKRIRDPIRQAGSMINRESVYEQRPMMRTTRRSAE